jgi:hypothetical protein
MERVGVGANVAEEFEKAQTVAERKRVIRIRETLNSSGESVQGFFLRNRWLEKRPLFDTVQHRCKSEELL